MDTTASRKREASLPAALAAVAPSTRPLLPIPSTAGVHSSNAASDQPKQPLIAATPMGVVHGAEHDQTDTKGDESCGILLPPLSGATHYWYRVVTLGEFLTVVGVAPFLFPLPAKFVAEQSINDHLSHLTIVNWRQVQMWCLFSGIIWMMYTVSFALVRLVKIRSVLQHSLNDHKAHSAFLLGRSIATVPLVALYLLSSAMWAAAHALGVLSNVDTDSTISTTTIALSSDRDWNSISLRLGASVGLLVGHQVMAAVSDRVYVHLFLPSRTAYFRRASLELQLAAALSGISLYYPFHTIFLALPGTAVSKALVPLVVTFLSVLVTNWSLLHDLRHKWTNMASASDIVTHPTPFMAWGAVSLLLSSLLSMFLLPGYETVQDSGIPNSLVFFLLHAAILALSLVSLVSTWIWSKDMTQADVGACREIVRVWRAQACEATCPENLVYPSRYMSSNHLALLAYLAATLTSGVGLIDVARAESADVEQAVDGVLNFDSVSTATTFFSAGSLILGTSLRGSQLALAKRFALDTKFGSSANGLFVVCRTLAEVAHLLASVLGSLLWAAHLYSESSLSGEVGTWCVLSCLCISLGRIADDCQLKLRQQVVQWRHAATGGDVVVAANECVESRCPLGLNVCIAMINCAFVIPWLGMLHDHFTLASRPVATLVSLHVAIIITMVVTARSNREVPDEEGAADADAGERNHHQHQHQHQHQHYHQHRQEGVGEGVRQDRKRQEGEWAARRPLVEGGLAQQTAVWREGGDEDAARKASVEMASWSLSFAMCMASLGMCLTLTSADNSGRGVGSSLPSAGAVDAYLIGSLVVAVVCFRLMLARPHSPSQQQGSETNTADGEEDDDNAVTIMKWVLPAQRMLLVLTAATLITGIILLLIEIPELTGTVEAFDKVEWSSVKQTAWAFGFASLVYGVSIILTRVVWVEDLWLEGSVPGGESGMMKVGMAVVEVSVFVEATLSGLYTGVWLSLADGDGDGDGDVAQVESMFESTVSGAVLLLCCVPILLRVIQQLTAPQHDRGRRGVTLLLSIALSSLQFSLTFNWTSMSETSTWRGPLLYNLLVCAGLLYVILRREALPVCEGVTTRATTDSALLTVCSGTCALFGFLMNLSSPPAHLPNHTLFYQCQIGGALAVTTAVAAACDASFGIIVTYFLPEVTTTSSSAHRDGAKSNADEDAEGGEGLPTQGAVSASGEGKQTALTSKQLVSKSISELFASAREFDGKTPLDRHASLGTVSPKQHQHQSPARKTTKPSSSTKHTAASQQGSADPASAGGAPATTVLQVEDQQNHPVSRDTSAFGVNVEGFPTNPETAVGRPPNIPRGAITPKESAELAYFMAYDKSEKPSSVWDIYDRARLPNSVEGDYDDIGSESEEQFRGHGDIRT